MKNKNIKLILFLLCLCLLCIEIKMKEQKVKAIELLDIKESRLIDGMPVYFQLKVCMANKTYLIMLKRKELFDSDSSLLNMYEHFKVTVIDDFVVDDEENRLLSKNYEATCVLYKGKQNFKNNSKNLIEQFEVSLSIFFKNSKY